MAILKVDTDKGTIEYSFHGKGETILIVHGGHVNCRETIFQKGIDLNRFCILTPSRPGYGSTPLTELNRTPKGAAALYMALLDKLSLKKVIVIGISAGGLTALEITANYSDRVEKLILMSALTKKWFTESHKIYKSGKIIFNPKIERFTWIFYRLFFSMIPKFMTGVMFRALSTYRPIQFTNIEFQEIRQMTTNMQSGRGFCNDLDQNIDQKILHRISCLTLILHSETDNQVSISHAENAMSKIKDSKMKTIKNRWGHMIWFGDEYQPVLTEMKSFLC